MDTMLLKVIVPHQLPLEIPNVLSIRSNTSQGSFGILPHRLDFVGALVPSILIYKTTNNVSNYMAIDQGIIVKKGLQVAIAIHHIIISKNLGTLKDHVEREFHQLEEKELQLRSALAKIESDFIRSIEKFHRN